MTEIEKMRSGQLADTSEPEMMSRYGRAQDLLARMRSLGVLDPAYRPLLEELIPNLPATSTVCPPFHCDHGDGIRVGEHVFINANCTMLDGGYITIGDHTLIGPNVQIYTPVHPRDYLQRRETREYALPVSIGQDCWLGGGVIVLPGVSIGDRCIIGAGSVVTRDVPDDHIALGNPARAVPLAEWRSTRFSRV